MLRLSIIIPTYNEEKTIRKVIEVVRNVALSNIEKEIIVIDDGSSDGTQELLKHTPGIIQITHDKNQGKGRAIKSGFERASGDIILIQDADLEYSPSDYPDLLFPILEMGAEVVYGSRFFGSKAHRIFNFHHYMANRLITIISNLFTNLNLSDIEVGYKVFTKKVIAAITPRLTSQRFGIEVELTARIAAYKFKIYEVGISYQGRDYTNGKKIKWRDGIAALWQIVWFNVFRR